MHNATHNSNHRDKSSTSCSGDSEQKKEKGRVAVIAAPAAGRSVTTRFVLGRELGNGRITCVRLTGRDCPAGHLTFPALLDCRRMRTAHADLNAPPHPF